jgi:hypothetical protein
MRYLLLIYSDESNKPTPDEAKDHRERAMAWRREMEGRGVRLLGNALKPAREVRTVRIRHNDVLIADGPFAETKEQIAGIDMIECADLDEALEVASKHPVAGYGAIEVRPFYGPTDRA